jgi:hypothetical protein
VIQPSRFRAYAPGVKSKPVNALFSSIFLIRDHALE